MDEHEHGPIEDIENGNENASELSPNFIQIIQPQTMNNMTLTKLNESKIAKYVLTILSQKTSL